MILSDRDAQAAIEDGLIRIDPPVSESRFSSTALDLTLHRMLLRWKSGSVLPHASGIRKELIVRPLSPDFDVQALMQDHEYMQRLEIPEGGHCLEPRQFVLGYTREKIKLPHRSRIAARVEGKSSLARVGVGIHVTAPTIHAGFGFRDNDHQHPGTAIQLEIFNLGPLKVILDEGMPICQLILEEVRERPIKGYHGKFNEQQPPGASP